MGDEADEDFEVDKDESARMVEVFAESHIEADIVCAALQDNGIPAFVRKEGSAAYPLTVGSMGEGRVLVPEERGQEALEVIGTLDDDEVDDPEVLAAPPSRDATWWVALVVLVVMVLVLLQQIRN